MRLVIHQPNFLPYVGFFHKLSLADTFVMMDNTQYDKKFTNRNKIKIPDSWSWLTVPINKEHKFLPNKLVEINTTLKFEDKENNSKKSYFEIIFATIIRIGDNIKEKKDLEKIILCDVQKEIYPNLETSFLNLLHNSGYPGIKFEKKIDFEALYNQRFN